ncbi:MAG: hypothetical protein KAT25_08420 [Sulfuriflexus sp.]|nr:hypothetical protein [Sulfuriflexus sp.]
MTTEINKTANAPEHSTLNPATGKKKILNDESRGLSAFFILGIIINIIMAVVFVRWFAREWRRSKNKGDEK